MPVPKRVLKGVLVVAVITLALAVIYVWETELVDGEQALVGAPPSQRFANAKKSKVKLVDEAKRKQIAYPSPEVFAGVKKFVFFIAHARSGHSIIGSMMDAHPHVVIANEFALFRKDRFPQLNKVPDGEMWKKNLFRRLYNDSTRDAVGQRTETIKGYSLEMKGLWQGKYDGKIEAIGDKSGSCSINRYLSDKEGFKRDYAKLKRQLSIPIRVIFVVRNPFDIISTNVNYQKSTKDEYRNRKLAVQSSDNATKLDITQTFLKDKIAAFFTHTQAAIEARDVIGRVNVLQVHNCDLVDHPKETMSRIFKFLEVEASDNFLDACAAKVFKSVHRSRNTVEWSPELIAIVEKNMKKYKMYDRYSFTSD